MKRRALACCLLFACKKDIVTDADATDRHRVVPPAPSSAPTTSSAAVEEVPDAAERDAGDAGAPAIRCGGVTCPTGTVCYELGPGGAIHHTRLTCAPPNQQPAGAFVCKPADGRGHRQCMSLAP